MVFIKSLSSTPSAIKFFVVGYKIKKKIKTVPIKALEKNKGTISFFQRIYLQSCILELETNMRNTDGGKSGIAE